MGPPFCCAGAGFRLWRVFAAFGVVPAASDPVGYWSSLGSFLEAPSAVPVRQSLYAIALRGFKSSHGRGSEEVVCLHSSVASVR